MYLTHMTCLSAVMSHSRALHEELGISRSEAVQGLFKDIYTICNLVRDISPRLHAHTHGCRVLPSQLSRSGRAFNRLSTFAQDPTKLAQWSQWHECVSVSVCACRRGEMSLTRLQIVYMSLKRPCTASDLDMPSSSCRALL